MISKIVTSLDLTKKWCYSNKNCQTRKQSNLERLKNESIKKNEFPNELKAAEEDALNKENYRTVNVLPTISKMFKRVLFDQVTKFSIKFLSPFLHGFRKGYSTQYALVNLIQK